MSARKLWSTRFERIPDSHHKHGSKVEAYRAVEVQRAGWRRGDLRSRHLTVYVDERDDRGWQVYERIDLDRDPDA